MITALIFSLIALAPAAIFLVIDGLVAWATRPRLTTGVGKALLVMSERRAAA